MFLKRGPKREPAKSDARKFFVVHSPGKLGSINPRRAADLKRARRSTALAEIRAFDQALAGINNRRVERWHVGRGKHPRQAGLVKEMAAFPSLARHYLQFAV